MDPTKAQNSQPERSPDDATKGSVSDLPKSSKVNSEISPNFASPILPARQVKAGENIGKYDVVDEIGRGGMSIVYKARDPDLNRLVAIKLMISKSREGHDLLRFQQEARAASKLEHPNIVKVHDFSTTDDGTPYLVMSYLNGISLADAIKTEGNFSFDRWLSVFTQACRALDHAHLSGVVHRDVKPSNFVLAQENGIEVIKLVDFGIAKNASDDLGLTKVGEVFGSPLYMSPEQCAGTKLDTRSDIYSLGCVMYEALAGVPPISGENSLHTLQRHLTDKPNRLTKLNLKTKNIQKLDRIVMRCLEKKPEDRYQNLGELSNELAGLLKEEKLDAPKSSTMAPTILVASILGCLVIFATFLAFNRLENSSNVPSLKSVQPTDTSKSDSVALPLQSMQSDAAVDPQTIAEKTEELQSLRTSYETLRKQRRFKDAFGAATRAAKLAKELNIPPFEQAEFHKNQAAMCGEHMQLSRAAAQYYQEAVDLMANPKLPAEHEIKYQTLMAYGDLLRDAFQNERAKDVYQQAAVAAEQQNNKTHQSAGLIYMGICEKENKNDRECLRYWKRAFELNPADSSLQRNIADLERRLKTS